MTKAMRTHRLRKPGVAICGHKIKDSARLKMAGEINCPNCLRAERRMKNA